MSMAAREQLIAFLAIILAAVIVNLAPIIVVGIWGKDVGAPLISMSDKTVVGLIGVLGTVAGLIFRANRSDDLRAENSGKAFDAITATAQAATPGKTDTMNVISDTTNVETKP